MMIYFFGFSFLQLLSLLHMHTHAYPKSIHYSYNYFPKRNFQSDQYQTKLSIAQFCRTRYLIQILSIKYSTQYLRLTINQVYYLHSNFSSHSSYTPDNVLHGIYYLIIIILHLPLLHSLRAPITQIFQLSHVLKSNCTF